MSTASGWFRWAKNGVALASAGVLALGAPGTALSAGRALSFSAVAEPADKEAPVFVAIAHPAERSPWRHTVWEGPAAAARRTADETPTFSAVAQLAPSFRAVARRAVQEPPSFAAAMRQPARSAGGFSAVSQGWQPDAGGAPIFVAAADARVADERGQERTQPEAPSDRVLRGRVAGPRQDASPEPVFPAPAPAGVDQDRIAIPDRWRLLETLDVVNESYIDPFNQNTLKADRPIFGRDWFLNVLLVSDSLVEARRIPTPVGMQAEQSPGRIDQFADPDQTTFNENIISSFSLIKGNTTFRPPDWEFRFTGVTNLNYSTAQAAGVLRADPSTDSRRRFDQHFAVQELFIDKHLWNKSDRYDFDSLRIGVQPFISDFRGFIFQDQQPGVRLFGNFANNRLQYNLAWFKRLNKDTNSGLNETELRDDQLWIANLYYQDFPVLGFQLQGTVIHNKNRERSERRFNENRILVIPAAVGNEQGHNYDVTYFGLNGDGHFDRLNLTFAAYHALGQDTRSQIAQRKTDIRGFFGAAEASMDFDWYRLKAYTLYSSGDENPLDSKATGFDAIFENPQFAGFDTSFFQRQSVPFIAGGNVILSGRNSLIPSLRSSKEEGQSNFVNPGIRMVGVGADFDILPEFRFSFNLSHLEFDNTATLSALRNQGSIDREIGQDLSFAIIYRPLFINNVVVRASVAGLFPGRGFEQLFKSGNDDFFYSALANVILTY
jgi:hypothetical protein